MIKLNKDSIYTLVGFYRKNNIFETTAGEYYPAITYRQFNRLLNKENLACVNIKWSESLNEWVIFQAVLL